jgi:DNA-binding LacI/PurR family transcriptional regulator/signal transduction histidine kinase
MRQPVLGVLVNINSVLDSYQIDIWKGVREAARDMGVRLVSFSGGVLDSPYGFESQNNVIYRLTGQENIDALVSLTASICNYTGAAGIERICDSFQDVPLVHLGAEGKRGSCILADNTQGVHEAIDHLVHVHGCRRIAHIRGTETNEEANARMEAYRLALERNGLPFDPQLVVPGDFRRDRGYEAIATFLDERKVDFDAVFSANDAMALGAIDALRDRGIDVPGRVSVVGFDDLNEAGFASPPLTTIRQPLYLQGQTAAHMAVALARGEDAPPRVAIPSHLVVRQSCGCREPTVERCADEAFLPPEELSRVLHKLLSGQERMGHVDASDLAEELIEASHATTEAFLARLDAWFRATGTGAVAPAVWSEAIHLLRRAVPPERRSAQEAKFRQALVMACIVGDRLQQARRRERDNFNHEQRSIGQRLLSTLDLDELVNLLGKEFRSLGIQRFWMCFHENSENPIGNVRLVAGYEGDKDLDPAAIEPFPASRLIPQGVASLPEGCQILVEALFHRQEQIGFLAFERPEATDVGPILLREHLASAIKSALLVRQKEERAVELSQALETLHRNQEQLLQQSKMATLGRMTAGIAHEMNTPLAAMRTAVSEAQRLSKEYAESIGDPEVTVKDHAEIAADLQRCLDLAGRAAEKAASYVQGIKTQTRDIGSQETFVFDLREPIREAVLLLGFALRRAECEIETALPEEECSFLGNAGHIQQIVTNLVNNALDALEGRQDKRIKVALALREDEDGYVLSVGDNGCGIPEASLPRIFEMLFTTKPFGHGTGLGLSIVHNLVGALGGKIDVHSRVDEGTRFDILLPGGE